MVGSKMLRRLRTAIYNPAAVLYYIYFKIGFIPTGKVTNEKLIHIPIYCINLPKAEGRRHFMKKQVEKAGFTNFQFIEGIDGSSLDILNLIGDGLYDDTLAKKYHNRSLRLGEIALSLSHGKIYEKIVSNNQKMAMIIEDDAIFIKNRLKKIDIHNFPSNWDIIFLSYDLSTYSPRGKIVANLFNTESWEGSTAAYLISLSGASKLADVYKPVFHASDGFIGRNIDYSGEKKHHFKQKGARTKLNAYLIYPECVLNGSCLGFLTSSIRK